MQEEGEAQAHPTTEAAHLAMTTSSQASLSSDVAEAKASALVVDLIRRMRMARPGEDEPQWGGGLVLTGAGCSVTAGIPAAGGVVDLALRQIGTKILGLSSTTLELKSGAEIYNLLILQGETFDQKYESSLLYYEIFDKFLDDSTNEKFVIRKAIELGGKKINWGHIRLGQLVAARYFHTVLTTNFDQLALEGMVRSNVIPAVADGLEALARVDARPTTPQLVHVHGSLHNYARINSRRQVERVGGDAWLQSSLIALLRDAPFLLVIGYSGEEEGLLKPLRLALESLPDKPVFWALHGQDIPTAVRDLQRIPRSGLRILLEQDFDSLMDQLAVGLRLGSPYWMSDPVGRWRLDLERIALPKNSPHIAKSLAEFSAELDAIEECRKDKCGDKNELGASTPSVGVLLLKGDLAAALENLSKLGADPGWLDLGREAAKAVSVRGDRRAAEILEMAFQRIQTLPIAMHRSADFRELGEALLAAGKPVSASQAFEKALSLVQHGEPSAESASLHQRRGAAWLAAAQTDPRPEILERAIESFELGLEEQSREHEPLRWSAAQNDLGNALWKLGERESGTARLKEAVAAFRLALEERTRDRVPLDWATTQNNLGTALWSLGARESGTARLEEAVAAFRLALEERARDRVPLDWATTQNNLGTALWSLGTRESGTARLEEAVAAFRLALQERTRDRVPLDWATTQNNLGNALQTLGWLESGTARLEEAVAAFRLALQERTRDRVPLDWATTQNNLGNALRTLGARESGTARLEEAVVAHRLALEERTRDRVPLDWAATQNNLGTALWSLGEHERGTARLKEAVAAYRLALEEQTRDRVPLNWAMTQNNLGIALATLGERESGTVRLEQAVAAYRLALEEWTRDRVPLDWAMTQNNLGVALATLGGRESGTARLEAAVAAYRLALEEWTRDRVPFLWAQTVENLALAEETIGERQSPRTHWSNALRFVEDALDEYRRAGADYYINTATALRDRLLARLAALPD